jgi:hypothetical protein
MRRRFISRAKQDPIEAIGVDFEIANRPVRGAGKLPSTGGFSKEPGQTCHFWNRGMGRASEGAMPCSFKRIEYFRRRRTIFNLQFPDKPGFPLRSNRFVQVGMLDNEKSGLIKYNSNLGRRPLYNKLIR